MRRHVLALLLGMLTLVAGASGALAQCAGGLAGLVVTGTTSPVMSALYDPYATTSQTQTFTFQIRNASGARCRLGLAYQRAGTPQMTLSASVLTYGITSGGASIIFTGGLPAAGNRLDLNIANGATTTITYTVTVPAGQVVGRGTYVDSAISLRMFVRSGGTLSAVGSRTIAASVTDTVDGVCAFASGSPSPTLDFTSAIVSGMPDGGVVQSATFTGVNCNASTRLRLSADALRPAVAVGPASGFDNFINMTASGAFSGTSVVLSTNSAAGAETLTSTATTGGAVTSGTLSVDISLVPGQHLLPGSYSTILTVTIDPNM